MNDPVLVALIASVPPTIAAGAAWVSAKRGRDAAAAGRVEAAKAVCAAEDAADAAAIGRRVTENLSTRFTGNGMGDVVTMLETLVKRAKLHDLRHDADDLAFEELANLVKPEDV